MAAMWFITLAKFKKKPTKEQIQWVNEQLKKTESWGVKHHQAFWTLGRYDAVRISEAPDVATAMKSALSFGDVAATETLVALSREEAVKLIE
jgi:uncharacterized protein with GYD domain